MSEITHLLEMRSRFSIEQARIVKEQTADAAHTDAQPAAEAAAQPTEATTTQA